MALDAIPNRIAALWGRTVGRYGRAIVERAHVESAFEAPVPDDPCVFVSWNGFVLVALGLHRTIRARPVISLAPTGVLGASMEAWLKVYDMEVVQSAGETVDGLVLRRLQRAISAGSDMVIAADGPSGPRGRARPGALWLGAATGAPVIPIGVAARPAIRIPHWDRHLVPFPGARIGFAVGAPFDTGPDPRAPEALHRLERAIDGLAARAAGLIGKRQA